MSIKLRDYQNECLEKVFEDWKTHESVLAVLATGLGKAQPLDAKVLTPHGFVEMGSVRDGDTVVSPNGSTSLVVGVFPQGEKEVYRVIFSDGTSTECCDDHLWEVWTRFDKYNKREPRVKSLRDIRSDLRLGDGHHKWFIPVTEPVPLATRDVPVDPYLLGSLLGDGNTRSFLRFSSTDKESIDLVRRKCACIGLSLRHIGRCDYIITHGVQKRKNPLTEKLREMGLMGCLSYQKFIPKEYLNNSIKCRIEILRGLMDTDGTVDANGYCEFNTTSKQLAEDVAWLVRSLGGVTSIYSRFTNYSYKGEKRTGRESYRVRVTLDGIIPFHLKRKAVRCKLKHVQGVTRSIDKVEFVGKKKCQCIKVSNPRGLYLTDDFIVTHNTEIFVQAARQYADRFPCPKNYRVLVICPQINLMEQAAKKLCKRTGIMPDLEQAHNWSNESVFGRNEFVCATVQTLLSQRKDGSFRYQRMTGIGMVVFDEAHLAITEKTLAMLDHFRANGARVLGVTATPNRHDRKAMRSAFDHCSFNYGITEGIGDGYLVSAQHKIVQVESLDITGVQSSGTGADRDFVEAELSARLEGENTVCEIAAIVDREYQNLKTVVFCQSVEQARLVSERLVHKYGLPAAYVCANEKLITKQERQEIMERFTLFDDPNAINIVCNVGILTTGWDFPELQQIIMAKVTRSKALYTQIFGRGTRPLEGVVDFAGSTPESRRAAIAASAKPHFKMVDISDKNLDNKIITAVDVLGGEMPDRTKKEYVRRAIKRGKTGENAPEVIQNEFSTIDAELEKEEEERRKLERARVEATASFKESSVDAFDVNANHNVQEKSKVRFLFGKYKGVSVSDVPDDYLKWALSEMRLQGWQRTGINAELSRRQQVTTIKRQQGTAPANFADVNRLLAMIGRQ